MPLLRRFPALPRSHLRTFTTSANSAFPKHAIITGGSRGIGFAIAQALVASFPTLRCTLIGRSAPRLEAAVAALSRFPAPPQTTLCLGRRDEEAWAEEVEVAQQTGPQHQYVSGDVASARFWQDAVMEAAGEVDLLVNAAGVTYSGPLVGMDAAEVERVLDTNLKGATWGCKVVGRQMLRRSGIAAGEDRGVIVNVASLLGVMGGRGTAVYSASKAGLLGLTRGLAAEMGAKGVRVNAVVPGYVTTDMTADFGEDYRRSLEQKIPLKRFGTPAEIADAVVFMVKNKYANNCVLNLDGGLSGTM